MALCRRSSRGGISSIRFVAYIALFFRAPAFYFGAVLWHGKIVASEIDREIAESFSIPSGNQKKISQKKHRPHWRQLMPVYHKYYRALDIAYQYFLEVKSKKSHAEIRA
jgi:hypothetical protein